MIRKMFGQTSEGDFLMVYQDVQSSFLINQSGQIAIVFDDANFVRSEYIVIHANTGFVQALVKDTWVSLGKVSDKLLSACQDQTSILLSGLRADGSILDLSAQLRVIQ
jgi:hypothetical protein